MYTFDNIIHCSLPIGFCYQFTNQMQYHWVMERLDFSIFFRCLPSFISPLSIYLVGKVVALAAASAAVTTQIFALFISTSLISLRKVVFDWCW